MAESCDPRQLAAKTTRNSMKLKSAKVAAARRGTAALRVFETSHANAWQGAAVRRTRRFMELPVAKASIKGCVQKLAPSYAYGLPVIGRCNYRPVITAVITVITTALFQLPVIGQDRHSSACLPLGQTPTSRMTKGKIEVPEEKSF